MSKINIMFVVLCGIFMPIGQSISLKYGIDVSKVYPIIIVSMLLYALINKIYIGNKVLYYFKIYVGFMALHTIIYYALWPTKLFMYNTAVKEMQYVVILRTFIMVLSVYMLSIYINKKRMLEIFSYAYSLGYIVSVYVTYTNAYNTSAVISRMTGGYEDANSFGTTAAIVVLLNVKIIFENLNRKYNNILAIIAMFAGISGVLYSQSRSSIVATILAVVYILLRSTYKNKRIKYILSAVCISLGLYIILPGNIITNINDRFEIQKRINNKKEPRIEIIKKYYDSKSTYIITGVGLGRAKEILNKQNTYNRLYDTHNKYINVILEYGIIGFAVFIVMLYKTWTNIRKINIYISGLFLCMLITMMFLDYQNSRDWWMIYGLIYSQDN